jgi:hypothetical protein
MNSKLVALAALGFVAGTVGTVTARPSHIMVADQNQTFFSQLDAKHQALFNELNPEGQRLALQLAEQQCKGQNFCKGLNSCKTSKNACAGQGGCKGQAKGPFEDKNQAVDVAKKHMEQKRMGAM